eukprot:comp23710_c0_seq1/m.40784 comp23710_c0_seq1/g.40784  ORF comp23710_c0_seq1/g.40784 comp23710_c0_seq1/m.40784 type:complete len:736 (-) comp23710_c0_seq1:511-2718(-)
MANADVGNNADVWAEDRTKCRNLFSDYVAVDANGHQTKKYLDQLQRIANRETTELIVELDDVYAEYDQDFVDDIQKNTLRYITLFSEIADEMMPEPNVEFNDNNTTAEDLILEHRRNLERENGRELNPALFRRFELIIKSQTRSKIMSIRQLRAEHIGGLVTVKGIVTRITEVKPKIVYASYTCLQCGVDVIQEVKSPQFMPLSQCESEECKRNKKGAKLQLQTRGSKFVKFQDLRVQELAHQVPVGHTPRAITVHARGMATRQANPGDIIEMTGVYLPKVETGFKALRTGLLATTYVDAYIIKKEKQSKATDVTAPEISAQVETLKNEEDRYHMLAQSIAPEIFGHEDVKKALLLLLCGGVGRSLADGMRIRGDLNICLMGDPGVAKSQLLRAICSISPRGVYTTGKGSSGVGLTAAVTRDPLTDELVLEGGALVLADQGICAIDEFDKMEEGDRTAIYEVMEQQTISIAKAGITTTLNARASILAAANPQFGRYNTRKSLQENVNLPAALLSRFDLLFLLLDTPSSESDTRLAHHVTFVHQHGRHPELGFEPVPVEVIRAYMSQAKEKQPNIPTDLADYIVHHYVSTRKESEEKFGVRATPRSLLALLRLSSAMARLRFADEVTQADVDEAARLVESSRSSLETDQNDRKNQLANYLSNIHDIISALLSRTRNGTASYDAVKRTVLARGFKQAQFDEALSNYESLGVIVVDDERTIIKAVQIEDRGRDMDEDE